MCFIEFQLFSDRHCRFCAVAFWFISKHSSPTLRSHLNFKFWKFFALKRKTFSLLYPSQLLNFIWPGWRFGVIKPRRHCVTQLGRDLNLWSASRSRRLPHFAFQKFQIFETQLCVEISIFVDFMLGFFLKSEITAWIAS